MISRILNTAFVFFGLAVSVFAQPPQQNEFVPIDKLPPSDQLPSAPLLITAYAFVWIATLLYLWTIWRRLSKIEADIRGLEQRRAAAPRR